MFQCGGEYYSEHFKLSTGGIKCYCAPPHDSIPLAHQPYCHHECPKEHCHPDKREIVDIREIVDNDDKIKEAQLTLRIGSYPKISFTPVPLSSSADLIIQVKTQEIALQKE